MLIATKTKRSLLALMFTGEPILLLALWKELLLKDDKLWLPPDARAKQLNSLYPCSDIFTAYEAGFSGFVTEHWSKLLWPTEW
ncbi:hypothetical protein N836_14950 [Leptolyngbya sp. Heron Island J]|nr:hypothetical protein N836_14950 [Leptolyngbya sp. Heron Island J]